MRPAWPAQIGWRWLRNRRRAHAALRLADASELGGRRAAAQRLLRDRKALARRRLVRQLQQRAGQQHGPLAQVVRRVRRVVQHRQHVARLQRRPDAAADRLRAVGEDGSGLESEGLRHLDQSLCDRVRVLGAAHLGGGADRHVEHHMAGAGGDLLRQHRGDQLALAVEVERALDRDQNVVGRAQAHRAAPDDAAAFLLHHAPHGGEIERDRRQRLHGVGGAGRRGDGARGGLRHGSPQAATIDTTIGVVRLPGRPPTQCLSTTGCVFQLSVSPTSTMARVSPIASLRSSGRAEQAVMKDER